MSCFNKNFKFVNYIKIVKVLAGTSIAMLLGTFSKQWDKYCKCTKTLKLSKILKGTHKSYHSLSNLRKWLLQ